MADQARTFEINLNAGEPSSLTRGQLSEFGRGSEVISIDCPDRGLVSGQWLLHACMFLALCLLTALPAAADWPPQVPDAWTLSVRETANVGRVDEIVTTGIPVPRALGITDPATLTVVNDTGIPVPANLEVRARWHAALDDISAPIQWLLVSFPVTVGAAEVATFRIIRDGSAGTNPAPSVSLSITRSGNQVTVGTGSATFVLGTTATALIDSATPSGGSAVISGSALGLVVDNNAASHPTVREVIIERQDTLQAVVRVEGAFDAPSVGGGAIASSRRYVFRAGSPTVEVQQTVTWEGDRCGLGNLSCNGSPNGRLVDRWRNQLDYAVGSNESVRLVAARADGSATTARANGQAAWVRQLRRKTRLDPLVSEWQLPGSSVASGTAADGASLSLSGSTGSIAMSVDRMHRYEPQALRVTSTDQLAIDLADDGFWLGARQGAFARFAIGVWSSDPGAASVERQVWAQLNHPLMAWADPEWFAASQAVPEFPVGALEPSIAGYDTLIDNVINTTYSALDSRGLAGLMTFGLYPRIWGSPLYSDEIDCFGNDVTPGTTWDNPYWCALWTDYHDTGVTVPLWVMRTGDVEHLHELAFPAARRMLFTQIMQCAPDDGYFYCGQVPSGYGGYRADNNGSHAYLKNLMVYYWLTGDESVIRAIEPGAATMRAFMCPSRAGDPLGPVCADSAVPNDPWAAVNGRSAVQWQRIFRFLGIATEASYLDDWQSALGRWLTLYYAQPSSNGQAYSLSSNFNGNLTTQWLDSPGTYWSDQLWMLSFYDYDALWRYRLDSNDTPLGNPAVDPSAVITAWGQTLQRTATLDPQWNDGTPDAPWPNEVRYSWSGPRVGGSLDNLNHDIDGDGDGIPCEICGDDDGGACFDLCLYDTGKSALSGVLWRAADSSGDLGMRDLASRFTVFGVNAAQGDMQPLSKTMGLYLGQLHQAVARMSLVQSSELFSDGFEQGIP